MKPRIKLAEAIRSNGSNLSLYEHDGAFNISFNGLELMNSKATASEQRLGELGVEKLSGNGAGIKVLVGGLGLGVTLQSVLDALGPEAEVQIVELIPDVVDWNRSFLKDFHGSCLEDKRVELIIDDVQTVIQSADEGSYDVILLDVDNGPVAMVDAKNSSLYSTDGIRSIRRALKKEGRAVFWSASQDVAFEARAKRTAFKISAVPAKTHLGAKRASCVLYVADRK